MTALIDTPTATREHVRLSIVAALRHLAYRGYEFGFNGHVTVRDPEQADAYWANPFGVSLHEIELDDLVLLDGEGGDIVNPRGHRVNGFTANLGFHLARPDAAAVVHLHTPHGFAWSSLGRPLEAVNTDAALIAGLQAVHGTFGTPGTTAAEALGDTAKVLVQRGHGFVTIGRSVDEAAFYLVAAERAAQANLLLAGLPERTVLGDDVVEKWTLTPDLAEEHWAPFKQHAIAGLTA